MFNNTDLPTDYSRLLPEWLNAVVVCHMWVQNLKHLVHILRLPLSRDFEWCYVTLCGKLKVNVLK